MWHICNVDGLINSIPNDKQFSLSSYNINCMMDSFSHDIMTVANMSNRSDNLIFDVSVR